MGAGNPIFSKMDLYDPETYYIEFYEYGEECDESYCDSCENAIEDLQQCLDSRMSGFQIKYDMPVSEDVNAAGWRSSAYTLLEGKYASVCTTSDTSIDKIIIGLIPLERCNFIKMCELDKDFADKVKFPDYVYDNGYEYYCCSNTKQNMEIVDDAINASYDKYIRDMFNPINEQFKKALCELYPECVYFPCGAWCSGKLVLNEKTKH